MAKTWKVHPDAMAFPRMSADAFTELKADIEQHGIRVPILVNKQKDTIIDGRNRMQAAHELKLKDGEVPIEVFEGQDETGEIISRNIYRRHLTDDQRAAIVAKVRGPQLTKEAEQREKSGKAVHAESQSTHGGVVGESTQGRTHEIVAAEAKVGDYKARSALLALKHAPGQLDNVIAGKEKLAFATRKAKAKARKIRKFRSKPEKTLQERVEARFLRFMEKFTVSECEAVRAMLRKILATG